MSIIAEALKKAQEKRTQTFENSSSRLEKMLAAETILIPKKYKRTVTSNTPSPVSPAKELQQIRFAWPKEPLLLFLAFALLFAATLLAYPLFATRTIAASTTQKIENIQPIANKNRSDASSDTFIKETTQTPKSSRPFFDRYRKPQSPRIPSLSGIMYSSDSPQAILNGALSSEGDMVGSYQILKILPHKVIVLSEEKNEYAIKLR